MALRYLAQPDYSLTRVLEELGYGQLSSFTRWFISQFEQTPSEFDTSRARSPKGRAMTAMPRDRRLMPGRPSLLSDRCRASQREFTPWQSRTANAAGACVRTAAMAVTRASRRSPAMVVVQ
ncbi:helix-turn-helix domain-containing protein [Variovorax ureilyticus]|uniref:Helix-turn-helix domain-containing protein n=1 Tax=Variovorax ureilyticus TaxID=1836198 RepID=A0ABU8VM05_9BURK